MNHKRYLLLLVLISFSGLSVMAQAPGCTIKVEQLPAAAELFGFRLGMTTDQVKTRVPPVTFGRVDPFGISKTSINPDFDSRFDKATFAGVRTISLTFLDGRLMELWIGYDSSFKWQTFEDFVGGVSKSLNLPGAWEAKGRGRQIICDGVHVSALMVAGSPSIRIADTAAEQVLTTRREEAANAEDETEVDETAVIGDKHTRLFYPPGCDGANDVTVANRVVFKDLAEAQKAGYKLSKTCQ